MDQFENRQKTPEKQEAGDLAALYKKLQSLMAGLSPEERLAILDPIQKIMLDHFFTYSRDDNYDKAGMNDEKKGMEDLLKVTDMIRGSIKLLEHKGGKVQ